MRPISNPNDFGELPLTEQMRLTIKRLAVEWKLDPNYLTNLDIEEKISAEADFMAIRVIQHLAGKVVERVTTEHEEIGKPAQTGYTEFPATWWDGLKFVMIQSKWLRWCCTEDTLKRRVRYTKVPTTTVVHKNVTKVVEHWHLCPLPGARMRNDYITFLQWDKGFTGSQEEYVLLTQIAEEALNPHIVHNPHRLLTLAARYNNLQAYHKH